jgi:hypothetical protein
MRLFLFHVSAAFAKHFARIAALHIPQTAVAARAGLVVEHSVGLVRLGHRVECIFNPMPVPQVLITFFSKPYGEK